jgi:AraC family transcriptional regulator, regulatory protein of adaptative response / methylated-DNA-[protein]-cysteine methyltransferase
VNSDYARIAEAIRFIDQNSEEQPSLERVADHLGLSPFHCQRLFKRWAGVSPKRLLQSLTVEHAKRLLLDSASVLETSFEVGLSGGSRLHDHFVALEAVTPGEYQRRGDGLTIRYGFESSPFGEALIGRTDRGVCALSFPNDRDEGEAWLRHEWPGATFSDDRAGTRQVACEIFEHGARVPLFVRGTNFQVQVWRALLAVPTGEASTYGRIAKAMGRPKAARAVGGAVGANRVAFLIPCHRVLRELGGTGGYRWGTMRKRAMLAWESAALGESA